MPTPTSKLGLQKPQGVEPQDVDILNGNFDILDKISGGYLVNDGVVPPDSDLYAGCLVTEKGTGAVWMAIPNGTGGFNKKWIYYPYVGRFQNITGTSTLPSDTTYRTINSLTTYLAGGINASATDIVNSHWAAPITGWFHFDYHVVWPSNATGYRGVRINQDASMDSVVPGMSLTGTGTVQNLSSTLYCTKSSVVQLAIWQNSGAVIGANECHVRIYSIGFGVAP